MKAEFAVVSTPNGPFGIVVAGDMVIRSGWTDKLEYLGWYKMDPTLVPDDVIQRSELGRFTQAVEAYYAGKIEAIDDIPVRQLGGPFRERAWDTLRTIAPGEPISYGELAERSGSAQAVRAAGTACATNNVPLIVPCHRVVNKSGKLGGFGRWGLGVKQWLLDHEALYAGSASMLDLDFPEYREID